MGKPYYCNKTRQNKSSIFVPNAPWHVANSFEYLIPQLEKIAGKKTPYSPALRCDLFPYSLAWYFHICSAQPNSKLLLNCIRKMYAVNKLNLFHFFPMACQSFLFVFSYLYLKKTWSNNAVWLNGYPAISLTNNRTCIHPQCFLTISPLLDLCTTQLRMEVHCVHGKRGVGGKWITRNQFDKKPALSFVLAFVKCFECFPSFWFYAQRTWK